MTLSASYGRMPTVAKFLVNQQIFFCRLSVYTTYPGGRGEVAAELDLAAPPLQPGVGVLRPQRGGGRALARGGGLRGPEGVMIRLELLTNLREDSKCPELRVSFNFIPE